MAAVMIRSDFGAQENKVCHYFHFSPSISHEVTGSPLLDAVFHLLRSGPSLVKRTQRLGAQVAELGAFQDPDGK